jgi:hypothetical protein
MRRMPTVDSETTYFKPLSRSLENVLTSAERPAGASGNRKFESISLQRRVRLSIESAFVGQKPGHAMLFLP